MRSVTKFVAGLMVIAMINSANAGFDWGGIKITSVRENQTTSASGLMFTSGTILASTPSRPIYSSRTVKAYAGNRNSRGVYVYETTRSVTVSRFNRLWSARLDGSSVTRNQYRRGFVYASTQYVWSSSHHGSALVEGLTFR